MKCTPVGMCGAMSAITVCFTEPTSETMQPGLSLGAIAFATGPQAPTGVQTITRSAPSQAAARSVPQWSASFSLLASAAVSALRVAATMLLASPRFLRLERDRAADQADADQRDLVEHDGAHFLAATKRASESRTAFTSASVPMVMRRCSGRP